MSEFNLSEEIGKSLGRVRSLHAKDILLLSKNIGKSVEDLDIRSQLAYYHCVTEEIPQKYAEIMHYGICMEAIKLYRGGTKELKAESILCEIYNNTSKSMQKRIVNILETEEVTLDMLQTLSNVLRVANKHLQDLDVRALVIDLCYWSTNKNKWVKELIKTSKGD